MSHTDDTHDLNWRSEGNVSPIEDPDPTPHPPLQPTFRTDTPDDDLVFTGVNHTPVFHQSQPHDERENLENSIESTCHALGILGRNYDNVCLRVLQDLGGLTHVVDVSN